MNEPNDDDVIERLRAAERVLDARPSVRARQAVLDAAFEPAFTPIPGARPLPVRWRWPLAAAATVLVGSLALRLAVEVDRPPPATRSEAPRQGPAAPAPEAESKRAPAVAPKSAPPAADRAAAPLAAPLAAPPAALAAPAAKPRALPAPVPMAEYASPRSPTLWVEQVIALRRAGRDDEADQELKRLRARYPDFPIPPAAQRIHPSPP